MMDATRFEPTAALGPMRTATGTTLGRLTTSEEQRQEAIAHLLEIANRDGRETVRATVVWSRDEPTILELNCAVEHLDGKPTMVVDRVVEMMLSGSEIPVSEKARLRRLSDEITELHERSML